MPTVLQFRRGTTAQNDAFTGSAGELTFNATTGAIRMHDGTTAGGREALTSNLSNIDIDGTPTAGYAITSDGDGTYSWGAAGATTSSDTSTNSDFYIHFDSTTSGAVTAIKHDDGLRYNPSTGTITADAFSGVSTTAKYADLAENYQADSEYAAGTVVMFGGEAEVTAADQFATRRVAGVVSTNPAHLMNSELEGENVVALALAGRVPCLVSGIVHKGDLLVASAETGVAVAWTEELRDPPAGAIIGKSLEEKATVSKELIEVVVGVR
jgi:hypothetical protein